LEGWRSSRVDWEHDRRLIPEVLGTNGRIVLGLIAPLYAQTELFAVGHGFHEHRLHRYIRVHRRSDQLPAQRNNDPRNALPDWVRAIHWDRSLDHLRRNRHRLADSQRNLPDRQHHAHDQRREKNAKHHTLAVCLHYSHRILLLSIKKLRSASRPRSTRREDSEECQKHADDQRSEKNANPNKLALWLLCFHRALLLLSTKTLSTVAQANCRQKHIETFMNTDN